MSRAGAVAVLEPKPRLRAHLAEVLASAGYRVVADDEADAVVYAADGPDAVGAPAGKRLALVYGVLGDDTPQLRRPFTPDELVHRLDDVLGAAFRGSTSPLATGDPDAVPSTLAQALADAVPELSTLSRAERAVRIEELLAAHR